MIDIDSETTNFAICMLCVLQQTRFEFIGGIGKISFAWKKMFMQQLWYMTACNLHALWSYTVHVLAFSKAPTYIAEHSLY